MARVVLIFAVFLVPLGATAYEVKVGELIEAERIGDIVGAQRETKYAAGASGGAYVFLPEKDLDVSDGVRPAVALRFSAPAGMLVMKARTLGISTGSDSFWYRIDNLPWQLCGTGNKGEWSWMEKALPLLYDGEHTFYLAPREPLRLDAIKLEIKGAAAAPYHIVRITLEPRDGETVSINPPTFFFPYFGEVKTTLQISRSKSFPRSTTRTAVTDLAFYRPEQPLKPGKYYWRMKTEGMEDWTKPMSFIVKSDTPKFPLPSESEWLKRIPREHPRLFLRPEDVPRIRAFVRKQMGDELDRWLKSISRHIGGKLETPQWEGPEASDYRSRCFKRWASKGVATRASRQVENFAVAYLLTGDELYGNEARRRAMHLCKWDVNGFTSHRVSDFANSWILWRCALAYDYCYDLFMPEEREELRKMLAARASQIWRAYHRKIEARPLSAHGWQHIIPDFGVGALALFGEVPEAEEWFRYFVNIWVNMYPPWSRTDGGWANGIGYYGTAVLNSVAAPHLIERATGIDTLKKPWHRNAAQFLIYGMPPGRCRPGFGDGSPAPPSRSYAFAMLRYARAYSDPYAEWYAESVGVTPLGAREFLLRAMWEMSPAPQPKPPTDLPKAKLFPDIGWVFAHSDLVNAENDIEIAFKSSPFGSYSHMHADQNSFVILVSGKHVCIDSGYYIAYGDEHFKGWYIQTKAHNSILIDGKGQTTASPEAFGRITDFYTSATHDYFCGDATTAYPAELGLKRFKRHILYIRPDIFVIYDELEADHPARFDWLLHSYSEMAIDEVSNRVMLNEETGEMRVDFVEPNGLTFSQTDEFDVPAVNWRGKGWKKGMEPANQWHLTASNKTPSPSVRFLTVLHPWRKGEKPRVFGVERIPSDDAVAAKFNLVDDSIVVAFRRDGKSGRMRAGDYEADALAFAASDSDFVVVRGKLLKSGANVLFKSSRYRTEARKR